MDKHPSTGFQFRDSKKNENGSFNLENVFTMNYSTENLKVVLQYILDNLQQCQTDVKGATDASERAKSTAEAMSKEVEKVKEVVK